MGLTHLAQFNLLTDFAIRWTIVEPSAAVRAGLSYFLPDTLLERTLSGIERADGQFDFAVVTSPTAFHDEAWLALRGRADRIFIEKPLAVRAPGDEVLCGYVLLHHPLQKRLREAVGDTPVTSVELSLAANTVTGPNRGWRGLAASGGGVVNEFGSHLLSLLVDVAGPVRSLDVVDARTVHSVDVPDVAMLAGVTAAGAEVRLSLDWTNAEVRKPTYAVTAVLADGRSLTHDFYELSDGVTRLSIAEIDSAAGVYLRGLEFTEQARFFLEAPSFSRERMIAMEVDRLLDKLR
jgi:predicted dehydrogenase